MKKTLVRLKVRREVVRVLTNRDLAIPVAGADNPNSGGTEKESGCRPLIGGVPTG